MNGMVNTAILAVNLWGERVAPVAWTLLWQSSLLIGLLLGLEWALKHKVRAAVRYACWLLVGVKLLLPPSLAFPTGLGWWIRPAAVVPPTTQVVSYQFSYSPNRPALPPPPSSSSTSLTRISLVGGLLLASGLVTLGLVGIMVIRWVRISRLAARGSVPSVSLFALAEESRKLAGLRRPVRLRLFNHALSPAVFGLFRPVILLPDSLVAQLSEERLGSVLVHEMIHLRRWDVWINCAQALVQVVYWWHPLLWVANARIREVREESVDEAVMLALGKDADIYAPTLLEVARTTLQRTTTSLRLVGILESRNRLRQRIQRLADFSPPNARGLTLTSTICILAFGCLAIPMGPPKVTRNVQPPQEPLSIGQFDTALAHASELVPNVAPTLGSPSPLGTTPWVSNLVKAEPVVEFLKPPQPPQIHMKAYFYEVPAYDAARTWDRLGPKPSGSSNYTILSPAQKAMFLTAVENHGGIQLLGEASVTTLSSRQTEIQVVDSIDVVWVDAKALQPPGVWLSFPGGDALYQTNKVPVGPTLDVTPRLRQGDLEIELDTATTLLRFLGYEQVPPVAAYINGSRKAIALNLPRFGTIQENSHARVPDGFSVLVKGDSRVEFLGSSGTITPAKKWFLTLVTATAIDPAGNRLHSEEEVEYWLSHRTGDGPRQKNVPLDSNL